MKAVSTGCRGCSLATTKIRKKQADGCTYLIPDNPKPFFFDFSSGAKQKLKTKIHNTNKLCKILFLHPIEKRTKKEKHKSLTTKDYYTFIFSYSLDDIFFESRLQILTTDYYSRLFCLGFIRSRRTLFPFFVLQSMPPCL